MPVEKKQLVREALSAVSEAILDSETGSAHPASPIRLSTCTANAETKKSRPRRGRAVHSGHRSKRFRFGVSDLFFSALAV